MVLKGDGEKEKIDKKKDGGAKAIGPKDEKSNKERKKINKVWFMVYK